MLDSAVMLKSLTNENIGVSVLKKYFYTPLPVHPPPLVYATDRSKAVDPMLFLILRSFVVYNTGCFMF